jgi:hypothetical protein
MTRKERKSKKKKEEDYPPQPSTADASLWQYRGSVRQPNDLPRTPDLLHCFPIIVIVIRTAGGLNLSGYSSGVLQGSTTVFIPLDITYLSKGRETPPR